MRSAPDDALVPTPTATVPPETPAVPTRDAGTTDPLPTRTRAPAVAAPAQRPDPGDTLNQTRTLGDLTLTLSVLPGSAGSNEVSVFLADFSGGDGGVRGVRFRFTFLDASAGAAEQEGVLGHPGHFFVIGDQMRHAGRWRIEVAIRREGRPDAWTSFEVRVR
jgi:hypothetical protein